MTTKEKVKSTKKEVVKKNTIEPKKIKRGLVGIWEGKIKINGDLDNVFNMAL